MWNKRNLLGTLLLLAIASGSPLSSYAATPLDTPEIISDPIDPTVNPEAARKAVSLLKSAKAIAIMRHALAPGVSDPENFKVDDCNTQRNLSPAGRQQARALGKSLRDLGLNPGSVYSSQWCRCLETAALLQLGDVQPAQMLNSVFLRANKREPQTKQLSNWLHSRLDGDSSTTDGTILVTHQANISALLGGSAASGEVLIVGRKNNDLVVLMRLLIPT